jgi:hypothetical protein
VGLLHQLSYALWLPSLSQVLKPAGASGLVYGIVQSSGNLVGMVGATALGRLSDLRGRKPVLLLALALGVASSLLLGANSGGALGLGGAGGLAA